MKIEENKITVKQLVEGYVNNEEQGVFGFSGNLNIRPPLQREFVYNDSQRDEVMRTLIKGFPLNVFYWSVSADGTFELLDGQQRTISICSYVNNDYSVKFEKDGDPMMFGNLPADKQKAILDYELNIYECEGTESERLEWFKVINIAGEELTQQEIRNAVYTGSFVYEAKRHFSGKDSNLGDGVKGLLRGSALRQDYLETALDWISDREGISIEEYMSKHQKDPDADEIWVYFQEVFDWVKRVFPRYKKSHIAKIMKGVKWGKLYNKYKDENYKVGELSKRITQLINDDEVQKKSGIFEYLLSGETNEKVLSLRAFPDKIKVKVYEKQNGVCPDCSKNFEIEAMEADHIIPWSEGGDTTESNCHMLCKHCNRTKSDK